MAGGLSANPFADGSTASGTSPQRIPAVPPINRRATVFPGAGLILVAAINLLTMATFIVIGAVAVADQGHANEEDVIAFVFLGVTLAIQILILWGGINMVRRRGYAMAVVGVIAAATPLSACWCLQLPFGIWALAVIFQPGRRAQFQDNTT